MITNRFYVTEYMHKQGKQTEDALGPVLFRKEEGIDDTHYYKDLLKTYIVLDIRKLYGLSLEEYLNQTTYSREIMNELANEVLEERQKEMEELEKEMKLVKEKVSEQGDVYGR